MKISIPGIVVLFIILIIVLLLTTVFPESAIAISITASLLAIFMSQNKLFHSDNKVKDTGHFIDKEDLTSVDFNNNLGPISDDRGAASYQKDEDQMHFLRTGEDVKDAGALAEDIKILDETVAGFKPFKKCRPGIKLKPESHQPLEDGTIDGVDYDEDKFDPKVEDDFLPTVERPFDQQDDYTHDGTEKQREQWYLERVLREARDDKQHTQLEMSLKLSKLQQETSYQESHRDDAKFNRQRELYGSELDDEEKTQWWGNSEE